MPLAHARGGSAAALLHSTGRNASQSRDSNTHPICAQLQAALSSHIHPRRDSRLRALTRHRVPQRRPALPRCVLAEHRLGGEQKVGNRGAHPLAPPAGDPSEVAAVAGEH